MASSNPVRTWILTGSVAAITATGAWYGAGLKTRQEYNQERGVRLQATPAERIEQMEIAKTRAELDPVVAATSNLHLDQGTASGSANHSRDEDF
ncbi:hypothetical protein KC325_g8994 [Hortaea werneckii]|nr:hypothetical protein KC361_g8868 [Hortaea werneckii]KAI6877856.1 hypothetical protein KC325_g8994 [Hortaea werneckii]